MKAFRADARVKNWMEQSLKGRSFRVRVEGCLSDRGLLYSRVPKSRFYQHSHSGSLNLAEKEELSQRQKDIFEQYLINREYKTTLPPTDTMKNGRKLRKCQDTAKLSKSLCVVDFGRLESVDK